MKTIYFENNKDSSQNIQSVKDELFEAVLEGKDFDFIQDDGDGNVFTTSFLNFGSGHSSVDTSGMDKLLEGL